MIETKQLFQDLAQSGQFQWIDLHLAETLNRLSGQDDPSVFLASALASRAVGQGHICLDLTSVAGQEITEETTPTTCLPLAPWVERLMQSSVVGRPGDFRPLILDAKHRLYLHRSHFYEGLVADAITRMAEQPSDIPDQILLRQALKLLFPPVSKPEIDRQKMAALVAVSRSFCVISGGPGTGKTTTVAKILALLISLFPGKSRIALTAPTGKGASRLEEAIGLAKESLPIGRDILAAFPDQASTLHRLLQWSPGKKESPFSKTNPLPWDVVVVDEASMVDLPLMARLVMALKPSARLILLGDKDQLAAVEGGAILGDLCDDITDLDFSQAFRSRYQEICGETLPGPPDSGTTPTPSPLRDDVVLLKHNYRFGPNSGIAKAASAIQAGDAGKLLALCLDQTDSDLEWLDIGLGATAQHRMEETILQGYQPYLSALHDPLKALNLLNDFRILAAVREGPLGVAGLNALAMTVLRRAGLLTAPRPDGLPGVPIMITQNDYGLGLYNGDTGLILLESDSNLMAVFPSESGVRQIPASALPPHETAFAFTVHKSQGSEFNQVLLVLPNRDSPLLTRELIYTGITRARKNVTLVGRTKILAEAVGRRIKRQSGLPDRLRVSP